MQKENPLSFNPFSLKKIDFTEGVKPPSPELEQKEKKNYSDDERIYSQQNEVKSDNTTINNISYNRDTDELGSI